MHLPARLGAILRPFHLFTLLAACAALPLSQLRAEQDVGIAVGTTGLSPVLVEGKSLAEFDRDLAVSSTAFTVDLRSYFTIPGLLGGGRELVQFKTSLGTINAEFLADGTDEGPSDNDPHLTVANFKSYLATDTTSAADKLKTYDGTFIHRAAESRDVLNQYLGEFVIQGGGYRIDANLTSLTRKPAVANEFKYANTRGTIAMAKAGGQPNSATSEWFFNLDDNSETLGTDNNGGFTVFARVLGKGMEVADAIAQLPTYDLSDLFSELPLRNVQPGQTQLLFANLVAVDSVRVVPLQPPASGTGASVINYTFTSSNPAVAGVSLLNGRLQVSPTKTPGRTVITVRAAEGGGAFVESSLSLERAGPPVIPTQLPATSTKPFGAVATLTALTSVWPAGSIHWERKTVGATDFIPIPESDPLFTGETGTELKIALNDAATPAATFAALQNNQFRFILTNARGTVTGKPTTLKITTLKVGFSAEPPALTTGMLTGSVQFAVTALPVAPNTPLTYQWKRLAPGSQAPIALVNSTGDAPTPFTGVNTRILTVKLDDLELDASQFICVISNALKDAPPPVAGTGIAQSQPAALRIIAERRALVTAESKVLFGLVPGTGVAFSAKGLPAGLMLNGGTGVLSGTATAKPGIYKVTVTTTGPSGTTARVYNLEILGLSGNNVGGFEALLSAADQPPAAKLALTVSTAGSFTGTLVTSAEKSPLAFKGAVLRSPGGVLSLASDLAIAIPGGPKGHAYLLSELSIAANGRLSAKLKTRATADATPVETAATTAGVHLAAYSKTNAAPWANVSAYNLAFTRPALLADLPTPPAIPAGSGYARAPVGPDGKLSLKGKLPDGAPLTATMSAGTDASYRLFARPYGAVNGAFVSSDFKLAATTVKKGSSGTINRYALAAGSGEDTFWQRPAGIAKPAAYPAGFGPLGLTLQVQPWLFFSGDNLGLTFAANNGPVTIGVAFSGATLANAAPNTRSLPTNLVVNFKTFKFTDAALPDASRLTLKFVEKTGLFSGTLLLNDGGVSRTVAIEGIFLVPTNVNNATLANGTVTAEGFATIPALNGGSPTTERIRLHQQGAAPLTP